MAVEERGGREHAGFTRAAGSEDPAMSIYVLLSHPFWGRKVRLAVFTLATFIALC
jgi:hypothetical protein